MDFKGFFKKYGIHFIAIALFFIVGAIYFSTQYDEFGIKQHDIKMHKGGSNEIAQHREMFDEEPLWTNSMFGGMPATQLSVKHEGNFVHEITKGFLKLFPIPLGAFLLHLISFYIMALLLRIKPVIAILGAFAFAFSSYEIIILQAGHNAKAMAVAFLPMVLGAFVYAYRRNWKLGVALSALFMTFEVSTNHLQVTYYLGFLLIALGIFFAVEAYRNKKLKEFAFATGGLIAAYGIALLINYGNLTMTNEYAKYTIRGENEVTINPDGTTKEVTGGLDKDYITQWSYGKGESFTMISPYVKGSHSGVMRNSGFDDMIDDIEFERGESKAIDQMSLYWGDQPVVGGPFYLGVIAIFLAFLALFFVKDKSIWVMTGIMLLALMLSWGKNFMGLTDFFIDNVPMYDKFRTVTIILVLVELCVPLLAILVLQKLYEARDEIKEKKNMFLIASGVFMVFLLGLKFSGDRFAPSNEADRYEGHKAQIVNMLQRSDPNAVRQQTGIDPTNPQQVMEYAELETSATFSGAKKIREALYKKSTNRTLAFGFFTIVLCALFFYTSIPSLAIVGGLGVLVLIDLVPVNRLYLGEYEDAKGNLKHWSAIQEKDYPISAVQGDYDIMAAEIEANKDLQKKIDAGEKRGEAKAAEMGYVGNYKRRIVDSYKFGALNFATNYRVFNVNDGWSGTDAAYFHKSIGGYHGAKLTNFQNVIDFHLNTIQSPVLDMLNVKYRLRGGQMEKNPSAMGNAWAVKSVEEHGTPNDELRALGVKLKIENAGNGEIYMNDGLVTSADVYGRERLKYWFPGGTDSIDILISPSIAPGSEVFMVMDRNGRTDLMLEEMLSRDTLNSFAKLVKITGLNNFRPREEVVMLKEQAAKLSQKEYTGEAVVTMQSYKPNHIKYKAKTKGKQLIVFSEIYYPKGWKALVDGKEQEILKVNYLLRGLEVSGGSHDIEFVYADEKYESAGTKASIGSFILLLLIGLMIFLSIKGRKTAEVKAD